MKSFRLPLLSSCLLLLLAPGVLHAQGAGPIPAATQTAKVGILTGRVADPSGAVIPGATVSLTDPQGHTVATTTSGQDGSFSIKGVTPGSYVALVTAKGFGPLTTKSITVTPGSRKILNATLIIEVQQQTVNVNADNGPTVSVDPNANASATVIKGADLDALSDDPDELSEELSALAGPSAGPSGGQVYVDGFTAGQLPPKSAIREIRVNQNPYGAQFDKLGYGRVEIFTKPGTDKFHGRAYIQGNARQLNTGNPFNKNLPDYHSIQYEGTLSGPINKNASFFFTGQHRSIDDAAIVTAYRLAGEVNGDFAAGNYGNPADYATGVLFRDALNTPQSRTNISPRVDFQLGQKNTLTLRYQYERNTLSNQGVGQFSLASQAYASTSDESTIQISHTLVFGPRVITETHLQLLYDRSSQTPANTTPQVQVQGNQTFGGQATQFINDHNDRYELSNLTELALGTHSISLGGRLRATREANYSNASFNGLFTFGARACPTAGCPVGDQPNPCAAGGSNAGCQTITAAQSYAATIQGQHNGETFQQIQAAGGGPSQLVFVSGNPKAATNLEDGALFYQDDWKVKPNFTFSYGLRWESQTQINDHSDWGPRIALAYGIPHHGKPSKDIIRAGFGYFYERFGAAPVLQAARINGVVQQQVVLQNPSCYFADGLPADVAATEAACGVNTSPVTGSGNSSRAPAIYRISPNLQAPADIQESIGLDQQLGKTTTASITYIHSHGSHQLFTINANAPYLPSYAAPLGNIYQYESEGVYNENQLFLHFRTQINRSLSMFGFYGLGFADSDTSGVNYNPSNSLNPKLDYGRAGFNVRNRLFLIGNYSAPRNFRVSPFIVAQSGSPFNITLSQDQNGDSFFNDRPSFAPAGATGNNIANTKFGDFNTSPAPGYTPIPVNYGNGPTLFTFNLRLSKTWGFGPRLGKGPQGEQQHGGEEHHHHGGPFDGGGGTGRRYNFALNAQALNLLNIINVAPPTGTLDSPLFGRSNALAGRIFSSPDGSAARRIFLQATFQF